MTKVLAFRLWGDYGHFKKHYTTTSPLTFEFPPPPAIIGIISAIIGLDKDSYLKHFKDPASYRLSVKLEHPVKKVRWTQNLIDTKRHFWRIHNRTQIRTEFLKDPAFKIYFYHRDEQIYQTLKENLAAHRSVYTVSLGLSELLADFKFQGELTLNSLENGAWQEIESAIPLSALINDQAIDFGEDKEIFKINYPIHMMPGRVVTRREDLIFERRGQPVTCKINQAYQTETGEKIVFL